AGRVPTDRGLRFYVDTFVEKHPLSEKEQEDIQAHYRIPEKDIRSLLKKTGRTLAHFSRYISLVASPKLEQTVFKHIEFFPLSRGRLLGILVSHSGLVENRILEIHEELNYRDLEKINNCCNTFFYGLTLEEARDKMERELARAHREYDRLIAKALLFSQELFGEQSPAELAVEGEAQLFGTKNFATVERIKDLLESLEEKQQLLKILDSCLASPGVRIFIGAESQSPVTKDLSLITSTYSQGDRLLGTIGVIGPNSMDYSKVISIVDFTARMVSDLMVA
ncbi:MAG: heat-inducible transcription repressor HrcA, partial [Deltaproteobacteria bacterium]|nr:heat-inducible transcription repressor HrcA [Deltaproteobacteria bacterium]